MVRFENALELLYRTVLHNPKIISAAVLMENGNLKLKTNTTPALDLNRSSNYPQKSSLLRI
jgi:hypothetical protein